MADSKVASKTPEIIMKLLPCSQQISLMYHISYLCLAKFPKLVTQLRTWVEETQLLFKSTDYILLECSSTSDIFVSSLLPMLMSTIERKELTLVMQYLKTASDWTEALIKHVDQVADRYEEHNRDVATTVSDIFNMKKETEDKTAHLSKEIEDLDNLLKNTLEVQLRETNTQHEHLKRQINNDQCALQVNLSDVASKNRDFNNAALTLPILGIFTKGLYDSTIGAAANERTRVLQNNLNHLLSENESVKQRRWDLQVQITDTQVKLNQLITNKGSIPDPVHLTEVQSYLSKCQYVLLELCSFLRMFHSLMGTIKDRISVYLVDEDFINDLQDMFLGSIRYASEVWQCFGKYSLQCSEKFRVQSRDGFNFLKSDPSSLSKEEWQREYDGVKVKLQELKIYTPAAIVY